MTRLPRPSAAATGRLTLDVIVGPGAAPRAQAGGTPANVLAALAYLGWSGHAIGQIGDDGPGRLFTADLARFGVDASRLTVGGSTPIVVHRIGAGGHSYEDRCPVCGAPLPGFEPGDLPEDLPGASAFLFDQDSPAVLAAARHYRRKGATVVWEPNYVGPEVDIEGAAAACDVLKYSAQAVPDLGREVEVPLLIETHGADGLRYRRGGEWRQVPAFRVDVTRDAAGCGDWTTAGYLHARVRGEDDAAALRFGAALAAWNAAFVGARGGMYAVDRATFLDQANAILAGQRFDPGAGRDPVLADAGVFCPTCDDLSRLTPADGREGGGR